MGFGGEGGGLGAALALWGTFSLAGGLAGALASGRSFLDEAGAARWLDERLEDKELLAAAIFGLRRGESGRFDAELIARAEAVLPRAAGAKIPRRPLARQGAKALAALALGAYLVFLSGAAVIPRGGAIARPRAEAAAVSDAAKALNALEDGGKAASDFARAIFPEDKRMAKLAERALREGRIDDLRGILKSAGLELDAKLAGSPSESERKKLAQDGERIGEAANALALASQALAAREGGSAGSAGRDGRRGGYAPGMGGRSYPGAGGAGGRTPSPTDKSPNALGGTGAGGTEGAGSSDDSGEGLAGKGGKGYGTGSGSAGDWGRIEPLAGKGSMEIAARKDGGFFELVLPDGRPSRPLSELVPGSLKSAEAAMSREDLPLEYEDFVRSYYLQLSKGESR
jgi:hypothetical protein